MKRKTITIDITSNGINLLNNNKVLQYELLSVNNFSVINSDLFLKEFSQIIKKENINNHFLTDNIRLIIDNTYTSYDVANLESLWKELSFNKVITENITSILKLSNKSIAINIARNNVKIYFQHYVYHLRIYFGKYKENILLYLKEITKNYEIKNIKLFGNYKNLKEICTYLEENLNIKTYIYSYPDKVPIRQLIE